MSKKADLPKGVEHISDIIKRVMRDIEKARECNGKPER
jgi:hypothetical protein